MERFETVLEGILSRRRFQAARSYQAFWLWDEIVGPQLGKKSFPDRLEGRVLHVNVESAPWAQELYLMKGSLLKAIRGRLGTRAVEDIHFHVAHPNRPPGTRSPRPPKPPKPRDPLPQESLEDAVRELYRRAHERGS